MPLQHSEEISCGRRALRPPAGGAQVGGGLGGAGALPERPQRHQPPPLLRPRHVPLPLGRPAHGPPGGVLGRRRDRQAQVDAGLQRAAPDRLGRLRPAGRERGHQARGPPQALDLPEHRRPAGHLPPAGDLVRLVAGADHLRPGLLPLDPVAVPPLLRARPGLPQGLAGQLVPQRPDGAGQRAGDQRPLRALRRPGREARADPVVLQDHRLRPAAAGRHGGPELERQGPDHAAQLDRALHRGRRRLPGGRDRRDGAGVHHQARHPVRGHLLRARPRAPAGPAAGRRHRARARVPRLHRAGGPRDRDRAAVHRARQGGRVPGRARRQPGQRRADPHLGRRLRAAGVRHRRHHGRARPRPARPRVRPQVRAAGAGRGPAGGGGAA